jgi:hypothetical protein
MASDRGKRQKVEQNAGGSQRSQTRRMRSTKKANAAVIEQGAGLNAGPVTEGVTPAENEAGKQRKRPQSAHSVKQECKQKIIAEMGQIVTGLIEKAKRGSYNEAKLLLTIADKDDGKKADDKAAQAVADASLAELLLGQLGAASESAVPVKKRGSRRKTAGSSSKAGVSPLPEEPAAPVQPEG